eukprot:9519288-Prorocentrum_lima.AAC.1
MDYIFDDETGGYLVKDVAVDPTIIPLGNPDARGDTPMTEGSGATTAYGQEEDPPPGVPDEIENP